MRPEGADKRTIFTAAAHAQRAINLHGLQLPAESEDRAAT
jgi:hypothetical protein